MEEPPYVQPEFRKVRETRNQIANIHWIIKKQRNSRETSTSVSLTLPRPLTVWITTKCGKFLKRWEYQIIFPDSSETCMWVKNQEVEPYMEQWLGSKLGKSTTRLYIVTLII